MAIRTDVKVYGQVIGEIWWPRGELFTKEINYRDSYTRAQKDKTPSLGDVLLKLTNDGDFSSCGIDWAILEVTKYYKSGRRITRTREISPDGPHADLFYNAA